MKRIARRTVLPLAVVLATTAAHAEDVTLDVTAWKGNEAEPAGLPELIEKFEAENPDIDVELSYIGRQDTDVVLPPRLQGDNPPDVMMVDMPLVEVWGGAGLLADLGTDSAWYQLVTSDLRADITTDGKAFTMPLEVIGMGLFTNMGLLKEVGIEAPPKSLDDLKAACGALADAGINPLIFTGGYPSSLFVIETGLEATDNEAAALGSGEATFVEDPAFGAALDTVRSLIEARCFDPEQQAGLDPWSTALNEFQGGNFAMMPQGAWNIAAFGKVDGLDFVFGPIPSTNGTGIAADLFGIGWSISAKSDNPEAAGRFVEFFAEDENLSIMLEAEAAYSPFEGGKSGTPELAKPYDGARAAGGIVSYPFALLQWPKPLEAEIWDSMTGFLLDTSKDNVDVLERWDEAVEDAQ